MAFRKITSLSTPTLYFPPFWEILTERGRLNFSCATSNLTTKEQVCRILLVSNYLPPSLRHQQKLLFQLDFLNPESRFPLNFKSPFILMFNLAFPIFNVHFPTFSSFIFHRKFVCIASSACKAVAQTRKNKIPSTSGKSPSSQMKHPHQNRK